MGPCLIVGCMSDLVRLQTVGSSTVPTVMGVFRMKSYLSQSTKSLIKDFLELNLPTD